MAADQPAEALRDLDRALSLQPAEASFFLELAAVYERLGEVDRAALAYEQVAALGSDDAEALGRLLLIRARVSRPDELLLGRLMDLLQVQPEARQSMLARCGQAIEASPYNPHLCYMHGVLLAQAGQLEEGVGALRIAVDRYSVQSDRASELEARLALQQLVPAEEDNRRRIAELHFERGEVHLAMQVLAGLARVARSTTTS
jgi:predicted Zn-dependent protease